MMGKEWNNTGQNKINSIFQLYKKNVIIIRTVISK